MKTIVFIGTQKSGSSYEAIKAADEMQYFTVLLTDKQSAFDKRNDYPHVQLMKYCDLSNLDAVRYALTTLKEIDLEVCAIVSFTDPYCPLASLLSEEFGLTHFTTEALEIMTNKVASRKILKGTTYAPFFATIKEKEDLSFEKINAMLPLVLKSPRSAGSKDVVKICNYYDYQHSVENMKQLYPDEQILVEEFLDGPQYLIETITIDSEVKIIAIIEQEITFLGRFIITGYKLILQQESEFFTSLKEAVTSIIKSHGLTFGPCHLEMRYCKKTWKLIEVNPRISGASMNLFIQTAFGINLVKETLKLVTGQVADFECAYKRNTFAQYVVISQEGILVKVTGKNKALNCPGVTHVYIKPKKGSLLIPPISMGDRYAHIIATGNTMEEAKTNAKFAASQIKFHLQEIDGAILEQLSEDQKKTLDAVYFNKLRTGHGTVN